MDRRKEGEGVSLIARTASNSGDVVHSDNERQRVSLHCSLLGLEARGQLCKSRGNRCSRIITGGGTAPQFEQERRLGP